MATFTATSDRSGAPGESACVGGRGMAVHLLIREVDVVIRGNIKRIIMERPRAYH